MQHVFPIGEDAQKSVGSAAEFDQAALFRGRQPRGEKRSGAADLRNQGLRADPLRPGGRSWFRLRSGQNTSMTQRAIHFLVMKLRRLLTILSVALPAMADDGARLLRLDHYVHVRSTVPA